MRIHRLFVAMAFAALLCNMLAVADEKKTPTATITANTRLVVVDVVAVDSKGQPVTDLTHDDFTLTDEGTPQTIKQFESHTTPAVAAARTRAPDQFTNDRTEQIGKAVNVVVLDALNSTSSNQHQARLHLLEFLHTLPPGERVGLYVLDSRLHMIQPFTADAGRLIAAAKAAGLRPPAWYNPNDKIEMRDAVQQMKQTISAPGEDTNPMVEALKQFMAEDIANRTDMRVQLTLESLAALARSLSGVPGRKNVMWLSEGFPLSLDRDFWLKQPDRVFRTYFDRVRATSATLAAANVAVYPIDVRGLGLTSVDASVAGSGIFESRRGSKVGYGDILDERASEQSASHATMDNVAEQTGGRAFYNRNDLDLAIRQSIAFGSSYYTLAYAPDASKWDGQFRKLEVKAARKGVKLFYRRGYYALPEHTPSDKELRTMLASAMERDAAESTALKVTVEIERVPGNPNTVILHYELDPHQYRTSDNTAQIDLVAQAWDRAHKAVGAFQESVKVPAVDGTIRFRQQLDLNPGTTELRVGVVEKSSGQIGTVNATL